MNKSESGLKVSIIRKLAELGLPQIAARVGPEKEVIELVNQGKANPEILLNRFGTKALVFVEPELVSSFLGQSLDRKFFPQESKVQRLKDQILDAAPPYVSPAYFTVLRDLGMIGRDAIVEPQENMSSWIPVLAKAVETKPPFLSAEGVREVFSRFTFEQAIPYLIDALNNGYTVKGELIDEQVDDIVKSRVSHYEYESTTEVIPGHEEEVIVDSMVQYTKWVPEQTVERSTSTPIEEEYHQLQITRHYQAMRPIAHGAASALGQLKKQYPDYAPLIDAKLRQYAEKKEVITEVITE